MEKEIYDKYIRMKKRGFSQLISHYPSVEIKKEHLNPYSFVRLDDKKMIISCTPGPLAYLIGFIAVSILVLPFLYGIISLYISRGDSELLFFIIGSLLIWSMGWYGLYLYIKKPDIRLIFDREKQKITFKTFIFKAKTFGPYSVDEVAADSAVISQYGRTTITFSGKYGGFLQCDNLVSTCSKVIGRYIQSWSFVLWYMDKNRPLPPVSVLEPYREKDDERRKNEGYPKPLFPTTFEFREEAEKLGVKIEDEESYPEIKERKIPARKLHKKPHRSKNK